MSDVPMRRLRDPKELRALAHPLRMKLIESLVLEGQATATQLADLVGDTPANCSWHLRQLAKYGYVEEAGGGTGRQRPWRAVVRANQFATSDEDVATAAAADLLTDLMIERETAALRDWNARRRTEPPEWQDAAGISQTATWLTHDELRGLGEQIGELFKGYLDRLVDPAKRPPGSRPVRLVQWGIPARPPAEEAGE